MARRWQLQEAKARLSELVRSAAADGPQEITVHGEVAAVLVSREEFDRLKGTKQSFVEFMRSSPLMGLELDIRRDKSPARKVKL